MEAKAQTLALLTPDEDSDTGEPRPVKTEAAAVINGETTLLKNPLQSTTDILCPKCGLPRLLYPIDGKGARKPEQPLDTYCKARPFIDKPDHDIYGQTFKPEGPGRGKRKADMVETKVYKEDANTTPPPDAPRQNIPFPHAKCQNCNSHIPIRRMNRHMMRCIGGGGRGAAKNANMQLQNGNGNGNGSRGGSQAGSRNGTPAPGSQNNGRGSPTKRSMEDDDDSDSPVKKKKTIKKTAATKLKAPKMMKSSSQLSASKLSFESRAPNSDNEDGDDDDGDGEYGSTIAVEPKKKLIKKITIKKKPTTDALGIVKKSKWKYGNGTKPNLPPLPPDVAKFKKNGKGDGDGNSPDSSRTMSSSPVE